MDLVKRDSGIKLPIGCTSAEKAYIKSFYNEWPQMGGILIEREDSQIKYSSEMKLIRANIQDAKNLWKMQIVAFQDLYAKYKDTETSPATEPLEKVVMRLEHPDTYYYYIKVEDSIVGAVRVVDTKEPSKCKVFLRYSL